MHFTPPDGATTSTSLMSIVEDVARANRNATQKLRDKKSLSMANLLPDQPVPGESATSPGSSTLTLRPGPGNSAFSHAAAAFGPSEPMIYIPKAPQSLGRKELEAWDREGGMETGLRGSAQNQGEAVTASSTLSSTCAPEKRREGRMLGATSSPGAGSAIPGRRPAQSPLRSALRNPNSRSGSPAPMAGPSYANGRPAENGSIPASAALATSGEPDDQVGKKGHDNDDAASVSSYETGREVPLEDAVEAPGPRPTAKDLMDSTLKDSASQTVDKKHEVDTDARELSPPESVQSSTGTPQRRKSVRVSLQPMFSPSPPAIYVDFEEQQRNGIVPPRGGKEAGPDNGVRVNGRPSKKKIEDIPQDFWENSSDEDEEYANAKRLLSRLSTVGNSRKG